MVFLLGGIVMLAAVMVACGGDGGDKKATTRSTTTTTTAVAGGAGGSAGGGGGGGGSSKPTIASFNVPTTVNCSSPTTINISWSTSNATQVVISIDGPGPYKTYSGPSGADSVPFACDGNPHTYMITAKNSSGQTTRTVTVTKGMSSSTTAGTPTTT
jgi:hypothetical protein